MKSRMLKQCLSILLVFALVISMMPMNTLTAFAVGNIVVTHDVDEIRELLQQDGDVSIKLNADAEKKLTAYSDFENYKTDSWNSQHVWTKIGSGNKTIDLNGYRLYVYDQSARSLGSLEWMDFRYIQGALLMEIPDGSSLTVNDSNGGGMIWMDAEMPDKTEIEDHGLLMERNIFAVTGGNLTVNGGEIHAGRSKEIYAQAAPKYDKYYEPITNGSLFGIPNYQYLYGYATWFLSGTAITAESGNVTINGGDIWGRGWDNWTLITRVPGAPNGADDFRTRCAALRVLGTATAHITSGNFYGRSDADAVQVSNPNNLTVDAGSFDVATNSWLVVPGVDLGGTSDAINDVFFHDSVFEVHEGYLGSFGVPTECINDQSVKVIKGNTMTLSKNAIDPYIVIDDLPLYINAPLAYDGISTEVYCVPEGCTVESVTWYQNGAKIDNPEDLYFVEGDRYSVYIALSVDIDSGTKFTNRLNNATINGKEAELNRVDEENLIMSVDFGYCTAALEELEFEVIEPAEGQYANSWVDTSEYELYAPVGGYSNYGEFRTWYVSDDGEDWTEKDSEAVFEAGKYYRFSFEAHAGEGQEFAVDSSGVSVQPDVDATVNGISATITKTYEQDPSEHITVTVNFGKCPALVSQVELTVTAPKEGETISYTVGSAHDTYYAIGDNSNYTDYRHWYESDTGYDNWREMSPGDTFTGGKYYKFTTDIYTKVGYEYPTYDNGTSIVPGVNAYINNYAANISKGYEQDPSRYITVEYFFGICNDSVVENIIVENVTEPVAGQKPNYNWSVRGNGYQMDTSRNAYYDDWMHNQKLYYVKNGLQWWDVTTGSWEYVYENDTFIAGHQYVCQVYLITEDGYHFTNMYEHDALPTATINGNTAEINEGWTDSTNARVYHTFDCNFATVSELNVTGIEKPVYGETPNFEAALDNDLCEIESITWREYYYEGGYGDVMTANDTFEDTTYQVELVIIPKDGSCTFDTENFSALINGYIPNEVMADNDRVYIRYVFRGMAAAPEAECNVHNYSLAIQNDETLVSEGNCRDAAVYYYMCNVCHKVEENDEHTFTGKKVADRHVGGKKIVGAVDADHKTQTAGYTGDTVCAGCDTVLSSGETIKPTAHVPESAWKSDKDAHWKICSVSGCGVVMNEHKALHTPDHSNGATENYAVKCTVCGYVIEAQLNHTHVYDQSVTSTAFLKAAADCDDKAVYYKSCKCGEKGTATFEYGEAAGHKEIVVTGKAATCTATGLTNGKKCSVCGVTTVEQTVIAAKGHSYGDDYICDVCGYENEALKPTPEPEPDPTPEPEPHVCSLTLVKEKAATCTADGKKAYYKCDCGKYYEDAAGSKVITDLTGWGIIKATGHKEVTVAGKAATCTATGLTDGKKCSVCGVTTVEQTVIAAKGHSYGDDYICDVCGYENEALKPTPEPEPDPTPEPEPHVCSLTLVKEKAATCTADGKKAYYKCSCGKYYEDAAGSKAIAELASWGIIKSAGHKEVTVKGKAATCTASGLTDGKKCSVCGVTTVKQKSIAKKAHAEKTVTTKATTSKNGKVVVKCKNCDKTISSKTIYAAKTVKLGTTKYVYNGKVKSPKLIIKDSKGKVISSKNYTVTKAKGKKNVGKYTYKIKFKNQYSGTKTLTFKINPKSTIIKKPTASKKAFTVKWSKVSKQATGYQIMYATNSKFTKGKKTVTIKSYKTTSKKITKLQSKKTYYVKVRTYKTVNGVKYYSAWSKVQKVKTR